MIQTYTPGALIFLQQPGPALSVPVLPRSSSSYSRLTFGTSRASGWGWGWEQGQPNASLPGATPGIGMRL